MKKASRRQRSDPAPAERQQLRGKIGGGGQSPSPGHPVLFPQKKKKERSTGTSPCLGRIQKYLIKEGLSEDA